LDYAYYQDGSTDLKDTLLGIKELDLILKWVIEEVIVNGTKKQK
jgi:hypothetical protein